jgi:hypothetical protein
VTSGCVQALTEWALRGKRESDRGYRLLAWSKGSISGQNFEELLTRYSPGTLESLPQVTISWIPSAMAGKSYLAMAIHEHTEGGLYDRDGRQIVFTRYFCVPYSQIAGAAISYRAMFEKFSDRRLPPKGGDPIATEFRATSPAVPIDRGLATRVVELLLSGSPVCIVDADRAELGERLSFIDGVMTLLPYGLRSRMSASTWTSSTTQRHKFRLFFSNSPRSSRDPSERDHVVSWKGKQEHEQMGYVAPGNRRPASAYAAWLKSWDGLPLAHMAAMTEPLTFSSLDVERVVAWSKKVPRRGRLALTGRRKDPPEAAEPTRHKSSVPKESERDEAPRETMRELPAAAADNRDMVEDLLNSLADALGMPEPVTLTTGIAALKDRLDDPEFQRPERRRRYWDIASKRGMLRTHSQFLEEDFYETVLRVVFGARPISYEAYCSIEDSLGSLPHIALVEAICRIGVDQIHMQVIIHDRLGDNTILDGFHTGRLDIRDLINAAATEELRSEHLRVVCDVLVRVLSDPDMEPRRREILRILENYDYLAPVLQKREPGNYQYQVEILSFLLGVRGGALSRSAAAEILSCRGAAVPTHALLAAVALQLRDPVDTEFVLREFVRGFVRAADLDLNRRDALLSLVSEVRQSLASTQVLEDGGSLPVQWSAQIADAAQTTHRAARKGQRRSIRNLWQPQRHDPPPDRQGPESTTVG